MAAGAVFVSFAVGLQQTAHAILNWRSNRLVRRKEKVDTLHRDGTHAFMSRRTVEAITLFEKALAIDPNRVDSLLWLGNVYRSEQNFPEAIRLHQHAHRVDERNIEILLELGKDLEGAKRYEEALQAYQKMLKIEPDNLTAMIRKRDLNIRLEKWSEALEIQHRLVKARLPDPEKQAEEALLLGCMYEVGRQLLERGHPDKARRYFRGAIKKDRSFLPAYIGLGEILVHEGKTKDAVEILKKVYTRTRSVIILHRLEELFLDQGEPGEIIRVYQEALQNDPQNPVLQFYLGKLYYRLEMVDEAFDQLSTIEGPQDHLLDYHKIMANLYLRKQQFEQAIIELKKALSFKKRVVVPYICTQCQQESAEWSGRCRRCARWNTLTALPWIETSQVAVNTDGVTPSPRAIPYQGIASPFETV
jgi:tetratricopeptide (TPR) repeat protein